MIDQHSLVERAAAFAHRAHESIDQRRKYTNEPYIVHPAELISILSQIKTTPPMLAAAWLHDTVEDVPSVTIGMIESEFGLEVARLVDELTDKSRPEDGNRAQRKAIDRARLAKASAAAKTIKLADLISNTRSIVEHDSQFAQTYLREKALLLTVLVEGDPLLLGQATRLLVKSANTLKLDLFDLVAHGGPGFQKGHTIDLDDAIKQSMPIKWRVG